MKKNWKKTTIYLVLIILISLQTQAALLGVNKVQLEFNDVLRGGYSQNTITTSIGSAQDVAVYYEARGDIADWVSFLPEEQPIIINENNTGTITVIVEPPIDTQIGTYEGTLVIQTGQLGQIQGNVGTNVVVAFEVKLKVTVTDTQILSCAVGGIQLLDTEIEQEIPLISSFSNIGNVRIQPELQLKIYDQDENKLIKEITYESNQEIIPTTTKRIEDKIKNELQPGQYWADIKSPVCEGSQYLTFSILEKGGISDQGEFIRLETETWAAKNQIIPITAHFKNRGARTVTAQFKGIIEKDNKIIDTIQSEKIDVDPDEKIEIQTLYTIPELGQYQVKGRITYNNKITTEKGTIINVATTEEPKQQNTDKYLSIILTIIVIVIGIFLFLILKNKKNQKNKKHKIKW